MILMKQKNFDSDVIPAEHVVLLEKHILEELKKLRADSVEEMKNVRTESERKSKLLAEYQATPMEVIEIDSLWDIINPDTIVRDFDERLRPLKESDKSMAALLNKIDNRTGRIDNGLDNQYSLIEGLDSYITKPSRRRRFFEFVWKNRYNVIYDVAVALLSSLRYSGLSTNPAGRMTPGPGVRMMRPLFWNLRIRRLSIIASGRTLPMAKQNPTSIGFVSSKRRLRSWRWLARMGMM